MKLYLIIGLTIILSLLGCHKSPTKPDVPEIVPWTRVESFGDEPVFALYVSRDSTELHAVSSTHYGYLQKGRKAADFVLFPLAEPIEYHGMFFQTDYFPYLTDNKCFMSNSDGSRIDIYRTGGGIWEKTGHLNLYDFIPNEPYIRECFGESHWLNLTSHVTQVDESRYFVTTEQRSSGVRQDGYAAQYKQFLISLSDTTPSGYNIIYEADGARCSTGGTLAYSTCFLGGLFFQDIYSMSGAVHVILSPDSPDYIQGSGLYPIRERFFFEDFLMGIGEGPIMKSYDLGINWEKWGYINFAWSHTFISGEHVMYYRNNISHWKTEETGYSYPMLESDALMGNRIRYLYEFDGYVYAATDQGLYMKPVSEFFTPRPEDKSTQDLIITRR